MPKKEKKSEKGEKTQKGKKPKSEDKTVELVIPILPNLELVAAKMASGIAELMDFDEVKTDEVKMALIEACINSFEHSHTQDEKVYIKFMMRKDELWLEVADHGVGFKKDKVEVPDLEKKISGAKYKRGWGLELMRGLMDKVEVHSDENGTTVVMMKKKNN